MPTSLKCIYNYKTAFNICDNSLVYDGFGKRDRQSWSGPDSGVNVKIPSEMSAVLKINLCGAGIVVLILLEGGTGR